MHFSKIYIQDNFVPDYATDPYRRKVIGIEVTLTDEKEDIERAKELAEQYIKEYIQANKIESPHIIERYISEEQLPIYQLQKEQPMSLEEQIMSCTEFKVLESYYLIVKNKPELQNAYDIKKKQLVAKESKEIIDKTNALCNNHNH